MKSLLALLVVGLALGAGYWKTQHPDASVADLSASAGGSLNRLKGGLAAITDGGAAQGEVAERLSAIESKINESDPALNNRLDAIEAELVETQRAADPSVINGRLTDAERKMGAVEGKLDQIDQSLSAITTGPEAIPSQVSSLDRRLELLNRRINEQSEQFNADSINSGLSDLESRIAQLQETQNRTNNEQAVTLASMEEKISSFEARLNTLSTDASNGQTEAVASVNAQIDQRIALLEDKLGTTNSDSLRIQSLTNELSASRVKMNALEASADQTNQQLAKLTRTIEELKTRSESSSIDGQQAELRAQLASLQNQMGEVGQSASVADLTQALQATRDRIENLEQRVVDLPASSAEANDATEAQSALQAQIRALEAKLANVQAAPDPNLVDSITEVEEKVSELASRGYVTQEELRAQQEAKSVEYKIYFDRDSSAITEEAGKVLNSFIAQEKNRTTGVAIYGFTDRRGSAVYNQRLALQRATNVRSYLIQNGFSFTKIRSLSGLGEDAAAVDLQDGEEDANQRTVVLYAQQP